MVNRIALRSAARTTLNYMALTLAGGLGLWSAIWLPTLALQHLAGWPFLDAYMMGAPAGLLIACIIAIAVMSYRHKVRQLRGDDV